MRIRPLRGQVVIRETRKASSSTLWTPDANPREVTIHFGRVLSMGKPARLTGTEHEWRHCCESEACGDCFCTRCYKSLDTDTVGTECPGPEVPFGFNAGDEVVYRFVHNEKNFTRPWEDGEPAVWIPQDCIMGVVEP